MEAAMIDLETLSLRPSAYIAQVGVGVMELTTGDWVARPVNVYLADEEQVGRHLDPATVRWWMGQGEAVKGSVFSPDETCTLTRDQLFELLQINVGNRPVWAKPAAFDFAVLADLFGGRLPWGHRQSRCLQTLAGEVDPKGEKKPADTAMAHNAAEDVRWQLDYLRALKDVP